MPLLLPPPVAQFCDANGRPFAGGSIAFYTWGTSTPKDTWSDNGGTTLNSNPVILDAAGRAIIFGDGDYRAVLKDADGNLIYDQWTSSVISDAMQPVVRAATIADALNLLGVTAAIQTETDRATNAESTLTTNLNNEITRATNEETNLQNQINTLTGGGSTAILPAGYSFRFGNVVSDSSGNFSGTFSPPFPNACDSIVTTCGHHVWGGIQSLTAGGFTGLTSSPLFGGTWGGGPQGVYWMAIGH